MYVSITKKRLGKLKPGACKTSVAHYLRHSYNIVQNYDTIRKKLKQLDIFSRRLSMEQVP